LGEPAPGWLGLHGASSALENTRGARRFAVDVADVALEAVQPRVGHERLELLHHLRALRPAVDIWKTTGAAASPSPMTASATRAARRAPADVERAPLRITPIPHQLISISGAAQAAQRRSTRSSAAV
jgi:hypothetical protein